MKIWCKFCRQYEEVAETKDFNWIAAFKTTALFVVGFCVLIVIMIALYPFWHWLDGF